MLSVVISPAMLFLLGFTLGYSFPFLYEFIIFFLRRMTLNFDRDCIEFVDQLWLYSYFHNSNVVNTERWKVFPWCRIQYQHTKISSFHISQENEWHQKFLYNMRCSRLRKIKSQAWKGLLVVSGNKKQGKGTELRKTKNVF